MNLLQTTTQKDLDDLKRLADWALEFPIEAAIEIKELRRQLQSVDNEKIEHQMESKRLKGVLEDIYGTTRGGLM